MTDAKSIKNETEEKKDGICKMDERQWCRDYFKSYGLSYSNIDRNAIEKLRDLIKWELQTYLPTTDHSRSMDMRISKELKKDMKFNKEGKILWGGIYIDGSYFDRRDGVFFEDNGRIAFCGWADGQNKMPIVNAFIKWCDWLKENKMKTEPKGCGKEKQLFYGDIWYKVKCGEINPISREIIYCDDCEKLNEQGSKYGK